ncbi:MAG: hypothetical protein H7844_05660 [Nitrospirae bacterium YQR-1]
MAEVLKAIELYETIRDRYSIGVAYKNLGMELETIEGYKDKALKYKSKGEEILNGIERAM